MTQAEMLLDSEDQDWFVPYQMGQIGKDWLDSFFGLRQKRYLVCVLIYHARSGFIIAL